MEFWFRSPPKIDVAGSGVTVARTLDWDWAFTHPHRDPVSSPLALDNLPRGLLRADLGLSLSPNCSSRRNVTKAEHYGRDSITLRKERPLAATELG
jgi:hypothetical protein